MDPAYTYVVIALIIVFIVLLIYLLSYHVMQKKVTVVPNLAADGSGTIKFTALDKTKTSITVTITLSANSGASCSAPSGITTTLDNLTYGVAPNQVVLNLKSGPAKYKVVFYTGSILKGGFANSGNSKKFGRTKVTISAGNIGFGSGSSMFSLQGV